MYNSKQIFIYRQLRARRVLSLYNGYGDSALLALNDKVVCSIKQKLIVADDLFKISKEENDKLFSRETLHNGQKVWRWNIQSLIHKIIYSQPQAQTHTYTQLNSVIQYSFIHLQSEISPNIAEQKNKIKWSKMIEISENNF